MTCKTCKYWERETRPHYTNHNLGVCKHPNMQYGGSEEVFKPHTYLIPLDSEMYNAWIETGENFGCINWEEI